MNRGVWYAIGAYTIWGFLPVYLKTLQAVPAVQILGHRVVWSFLFLAIIISLRNEWSHLFKDVSTLRILPIYFLAACLLAVNWLTYIWGVNNNFIVETSLGYFINPLVSVVMGVVFLRERLRPLQWVPIGLAVIGVLYLTISYGALPWIALVLAFSFGLYGLVKKTAPLGALNGLTIETAILFLPAVVFLVVQEMQDVGAMGNLGLRTDVLLALAGVVTALPLLMFATAARRIPLTMLGILQYIAPTIQFLLGVFVFNEPFTQARLIGFSLIWAALLLYSLEGVFDRRRSALLAAS